MLSSGKTRPLLVHIYGSNQYLTETGDLGTIRYGGIRTTACNWENNASNAVSNWSQSSNDFTSNWIGVVEGEHKHLVLFYLLFMIIRLLQAGILYLPLQMAGYLVCIILNRFLILLRGWLYQASCKDIF